MNLEPRAGQQLKKKLVWHSDCQENVNRDLSKSEEHRRQTRRQTSNYRGKDKRERDRDFEGAEPSQRSVKEKDRWNTRPENRQTTRLENRWAMRHIYKRTGKWTKEYKTPSERSKKGKQKRSRVTHYIFTFFIGTDTRRKKEKPILTSNGDQTIQKRGTCLNVAFL